MQEGAAALLGLLAAGVEEQELAGREGGGGKGSMLQRHASEGEQNHDAGTGRCSKAAALPHTTLVSIMITRRHNHNHSAPNTVTLSHLRELRAVRKEHAALKGGQQAVPCGAQLARRPPPLQVLESQLHHAVQFVRGFVHSGLSGARAGRARGRRCGERGEAGGRGE